MSEFTFRAFLRDRKTYILVYAAFGLLTAVVVQLDLSLSGSSLNYVNLIYIVLLGLVGLVLFLVVDYRRQARFFREVIQRIDETNDAQTLDKLSVLAFPVTLEQQLFADAWSSLYARLSTGLFEEHHRTRRRLHFLSQWAHHMKTPVAVIDLELQKARREQSDPEQLIQSIAEENERLGRSLQALLNAVRLDDFTSDFKVEPVNLLQLARQVVNDYRHAFISHGVFPKVDEPDPATGATEFLTVRSDAKWLRLILEQVVSNAIKYSSGKYSSGEARKGKVTISFIREGNRTILEVSDNGIGIAPEDQGRIFDPFFTGSTGRKHAVSTGLGLYLAREACERLGHTIAVRSTPGEGTQVTIGFSGDTSIFAGMSHSLTAK